MNYPAASSSASRSPGRWRRGPASCCWMSRFPGLDRRLRDQVRADTLAVLRDARATCIIVTHDPEEAMRLADRIALLRGGELVQLGAPEALYRAPRDIGVARFFCELNEMPGQVAGGEVTTPLGRFAAPDLAPGRAVVAIRPQGLGFTRGTGRVQGRVIDRRFLGEVDLLEVIIEGLERPLVRGCGRAGIWRGARRWASTSTRRKSLFSPRPGPSLAPQTWGSGIRPLGHKILVEGMAWVR